MQRQWHAQPQEPEPVLVPPTSWSGKDGSVTGKFSAATRVQTRMVPSVVAPPTPELLFLHPQLGKEGSVVAPPTPELLLPHPQPGKEGSVVAPPLQPHLQCLLQQHIMNQSPWLLNMDVIAEPITVYARVKQ